MEKIFEQAKDLHVVATCVYDKADGNAYTDKACTVQFTTAELQEAFIKGAVVVDAAGVMYKPVSAEVDGGVCTINYIVPNASTATSADIESLVSKADEAGE